MHITPTPLPGVLLLKPKRFYDPRGFFVESYHRARLAETGIRVDFVQDNLSFSKRALTLRGLHFQREPFAQAKLVSVITGAATRHCRGSEKKLASLWSTSGKAAQGG